MKCDLCPQEAIWDTPLNGGSWANVCQSCFDVYGGNAVIGSVLQPPVEKRLDLKSPVPVNGIEVTSVEDLMDDLDRFIKCPRCSHQTKLEIDADGSYICSGCDSTILMNALV